MTRRRATYEATGSGGAAFIILLATVVILAVAFGGIVWEVFGQ